MRKSMTQISLRIRAGWSKTPTGALWISKEPTFNSGRQWRLWTDCVNVQWSVFRRVPVVAFSQVRGSSEELICAYKNNAYCTTAVLYWIPLSCGQGSLFAYVIHASQCFSVVVFPTRRLYLLTCLNKGYKANCEDLQLHTRTLPNLWRYDLMHLGRMHVLHVICPIASRRRGAGIQSPPCLVLQRMEVVLNPLLSFHLTYTQRVFNHFCV